MTHPTTLHSHVAIRPLSLGFTRGLWNDASSTDGDTRARLTAYARAVTAYHVVTHSLRKHQLPTPVQMADNFWAYATNGRTPLHAWLAMLALGRQIAQTQAINIIQAQDPTFTGLIALLLSRWHHIPYNVCVYGPNPFDQHWLAESRRNRLLAVIARMVLRQADSIQVDGAQTKAVLAQAGIQAERIHVKPMVPLNLPHFLQATPDPAVRATLTDNGRYEQLALFVGRLVPQKHVTMLLEVAAQLAATFPKLRFVCVGDGPQRAGLEQHAQALGVQDRVLFVGTRAHTKIASYMASCDLFLLPSRYEGFARVLMEAAAAARPIVTTAVSGAVEAVQDGVSGYITPVGDRRQFAARITTLLSNPANATAMGRVGRTDIQAFAERYGNPYRQIEIWEAMLARHAAQTNLKDDSNAPATV